MLKALSLLSLTFLLIQSPIYAQENQEDTSDDSPFGKIRLREKCAQNPDSCPDEQVLEAVKPMLVNRLDRLEQHLNQYVKKVKNEHELTSEEEQQLEALLEEYTALVEDLKSEITGIESVQALRERVQNILNEGQYLQRLRMIDTRRLHAGTIRVEKAITRMNSFISRVESHVEAAQEEGHDTTEVEALVSSAKESTRQAQQDFDIALGLIQDMLDSEDYGDTAEVRALLLGVRDSLRSAHQDLQEAVSLLKVLYRENPWTVQEG